MCYFTYVWQGWIGMHCGLHDMIMALLTISCRFWIDLFKSIGRSARWTWQQRPFLRPRRSATRVCVEPTFVLPCIAMENVSSETKCGNTEMRFLTSVVKHGIFTGPTLRWWIPSICTNSCTRNGCIGRSGTQIAEHRVATKHRKNSYFNFRGATAIFLAYRQWR